MSHFNHLPWKTKSPPVKDRPTCRSCGKKLTPDISLEYSTFPNGTAMISDPVAQTWSGHYARHYKLGDLFCSDKCAILWAVTVCHQLDKEGKGLSLATALKRRKEGKEKKGKGGK